jgi:hypothetical protein
MKMMKKLSLIGAASALLVGSASATLLTSFETGQPTGPSGIGTLATSGSGITDGSQAVTATFTIGSGGYSEFGKIWLDGNIDQSIRTAMYNGTATELTMDFLFTGTAGGWGGNVQIAAYSSANSAQYSFGSAGTVWNQNQQTGASFDLQQVFGHGYSFNDYVKLEIDAGHNPQVKFYLNRDNNNTEGTIVMDNINVIPEPATLGLVATCAGGMLFIRRRFMI